MFRAGLCHLSICDSVVAAVVSAAEIAMSSHSLNGLLPPSADPLDVESGSSLSNNAEKDEDHSLGPFNIDTTKNVSFETLKRWRVRVFFYF